MAACVLAESTKVERSILSHAEKRVIPHGVDSSVFYPLEGGVEDGEALSGRQRARRKIFPHSPEFLDGLIVLNANRNQPRKRIDTTMRGFALFAEDKPENVKLFLHMGRKDSGWDLVKLAQYLGLEDRLILSTFEDDMPGVSRSHLNLIYNACDVGLNTASSEGWGLANFEHGATGAAQVLPRHSAFADLWDGAAVMVEPVAELIQEQLLIRAWLVSPEGVAAALQRLYDDPDELTEMSNLAWTLANRPEFRWQAISERWRAIFEAAIKKPT